MTPELLKPESGLQRIEVPAMRADDPMALLTMAVQRGADVGTLERLAALRDKFLAEKARKAYFDSLAAFQRECPVIVKTSKVLVGGSERYRYAPIDRIIKVVGPLLEKHGFAYQRDSKIEQGWVEAIVTITHREGHSETKSFRVPSESKAGMSEAQKYGAALTFADRYAFCGALGIKTGEEDTDMAPGAEGPEVLLGLKTMLWNLLKAHLQISTWDQARQWLTDEMLMDPEQTIKELLANAAALRSIIAKATTKLEAKQ